MGARNCLGLVWIKKSYAMINYVKVSYIRIINNIVAIYKARIIMRD